MSELRFKTGETNSLEKNIVKSQSLEVKNLLLVNENDQKVAKIKLQTLLNTSDNIAPSEKLIKRDFNVLQDISKISENPALKAFKHQIEISKLTQSVEKSRLLPDFSIGAFSQTLPNTYLKAFIELGEANVPTVPEESVVSEEKKLYFYLKREEK